MTDGVHPIEQLFGAMGEVEPFPPRVVPFPGRLEGIGSFPAGAGLWVTSPAAPLPAMPVGGVMVLGHDFTRSLRGRELRRADSSALLLRSS
jgi:hypothetical protein